MTGAEDPGVRVARRRLRLLSAVFTLALGALGLRLVDLAFTVDEVISSPAMATAAVQGGRADIVDRNGFLLATDYLKTSLFADPAEVIDVGRTAERLARVLPVLDLATLRQKLARPGRFVWLKRHLTDAEQQAIIRLGLPGIRFRTEMHRVYPQRELTAHLVGYVGIENQGLAGIERSFEERLRAPGRQDDPLVLTLDLRVQEIVRSELAEAVERFRAEGASAIVLDASNGEILGMVSLPDFDPNHYERAQPAARFNRSTQGTYEVGSLFKLFTAAMALDGGAAAIGDRLDAIEPLRFGRFRIGDFHAKRRILSVPEVIAFSSNIGVAQMAMALGLEQQQAYLGRFGLLERHPLRLPEVADPQLPSPWRPINGVTIAYGHGIAVSPLQVADALAGILCGAPWQRAHLVPEDLPPAVRTAPVRPETGAMLRWLMWLTVERGTGGQAAVPGYLVGGKTGSADKVGRGGYRDGGLLSSFIGAFPMQAPRFVVLAVLDRPKGDARTFNLAHGGWTAAPVVGRIIARTGPLLGLAPEAAEARGWFDERLRIGHAFNGRLKRTEESYEAARGASWAIGGVNGIEACGCPRCSTLM
jgi:cell division protein FtsI (penicillin-binding protein 3)